MEVKNKENVSAVTALPEEVVDGLIKKGLKISAAESCTGGLFVKLITDIPGTSAVIDESYITYSNGAKSRILGVCEETLEAYGAVSAETAYEMAAGVKNITGADLGVGITGVAGPAASERKPVGLVYFGISYKENVSVFKLSLKGDREQIRFQTCMNVFDEIKKIINKI